MNNISQYQLILFDFDGTLCHSELADIRTLQKAYQILNTPIPSTETIQSAMKTGATSSNLLKQLNPDASSDFIEELGKTYTTYYPSEAASATLFPGVNLLLEKLQKAGIDMAIVSNRDASLLSVTAAALRIEGYFKTIMGVESGGSYKPDPALYENNIAPYFPSIPTQATLMVGDTDTDLRFASNIGVDACWASYGGGFREKCEILQPKYTIKTADELLSIIGLAKTM